MSPTRPRLPRPFKYFSLFSGIGGFELGIQTAFTKRYSTCDQSYEYQKQPESCSCGDLWEPKEKLRSSEENIQSGGHSSHTISSDGNGWGVRSCCIGFSEIDKYAAQVYKNHFDHKECGDVSTIDWSDTENFDFLVGGFPCQAFSIAGKRQGFDDTRGTLFFEIARCLSEKQPRFLLLENVKGLLSHGKGKTFGIILNTLDELGYDLQWQVLNSKNFGVPQNRERVFIVGHLRGTRRPEIFPIGEIDSRIYEQKQNFQPKVQSTIKIGNITYADESLLQTRSDRPLSIRRLTPTECERLQGFPDGWTEGISDTQRYKCLGNAVTVNVIETIMVKLLGEIQCSHTK